jgi:FAD/FMN-containing dehydrogenase
MQSFCPPNLTALQSWMQDPDQPAGWCVDKTYASQLTNPRWLDLDQLDKIRWISPEDLTLTVETGITLGRLRDLLAEKQLCWPFFAPAAMRLGDFLAQDGPGLEAGLLGYPRDWVLGTETLVPATGQLSEAGGRVVKNVTGYDLNKLVVGSHHSLGVLTAVTLKLQRLGEAAIAGEAQFDDATDAFRFVDFLLRQDDQLAICEVYQASRLDNRHKRNDFWHVIIELRADAALLKTLQPIVCEFSTTLQWITTGPARNQRLLALQQWPKTAWVFEWAFPPAASLLVCREIHNTFGLLDRPVMQVRPAAGVLYTMWTGFEPPDGLNGRIQSILTAMSQVGLTVQCIQSPDAQAYRTYNLPADKGVYRMMRTLKQLYDPNNRLENPRLSL